MWRREYFRPRLSLPSGGPGAVAFGSPNLFSKSEAFDNAAWSKNNATVTANTTTAPDGATMADTLADNATNSFHGTNQASPVTSGKVTFSVYAKGETCDIISLVFGNEGSGAAFNVTTGTVANTDAGGFVAGISAAGNGFYRCWVTFTLTGADNCYVLLNPAGAGGTPFYSGSGKTVFVWGAQLQQGPIGPYRAVP